jgi:TRAP transporter TAXI family solute receptor
MKTFRRTARFGALAMLVSALLGGAAVAQAPSFVSIGTASPAGAYYPLGVAMADLWNRNIEGIRFSAQETGGGVANINMLAGGEIELGIANENIAWDAAQGNEPFGSPIEVAGGWTMNASYALIVTRADSGLQSVADLAGKVLVDVANPLDFSAGFPPTVPRAGSRCRTGITPSTSSCRCRR